VTLLIGGARFVGTRLGGKLFAACILDINEKDNAQFIDITKPWTFKLKLEDANSIVLLAAEHRDDVSPTTKYYDANVLGTQNYLDFFYQMWHFRSKMSVAVT
jgi:GlcNAc-P-P-Und epimerase